MLVIIIPELTNVLACYFKILVKFDKCEAVLYVGVMFRDDRHSQAPPFLPLNNTQRNAIRVRNFFMVLIF